MPVRFLEKQLSFWDRTILLADDVGRPLSVTTGVRGTGWTFIPRTTNPSANVAFLRGPALYPSRGHPVRARARVVCARDGFNIAPVPVAAVRSVGLSCRVRNAKRRPVCPVTARGPGNAPA